MKAGVGRSAISTRCCVLSLLLQQNDCSPCLLICQTLVSASSTSNRQASLVAVEHNLPTRR